jgi:hypothetical protein
MTHICLLSWNSCLSIQYAYIYIYVCVCVCVCVCDFFVKLVCLCLHLSKSFIYSALRQILIELDVKTSKYVLT